MYRCIRYEHITNEQAAALNISHERMDDLVQTFEMVLAEHPEKFPIIKGTKLRLCKTNEFSGMRFRGIPSLAIYFHYDDQAIYLVSLEEDDSESYGLQT